MLNHIAKFYKLQNNESHAYYDFTKLVGYDCALEITPWHKGLSWKNVFEDTEWQDDFYNDPRINFSFLVYAEENLTWKSGLPNQLITPLIEFEAKHSLSMFPVLWILSRSQSATELFLSAPYLFWIIITAVLNSNMSEQKILSLFNEKRSDILKNLGFLNNKSILKFMSKLSYTTMNKKKHAAVWRLIEITDYKSLNHLPIIHLALVEFILQNPQLISAKFIKTIKEPSEINQLKHYLRDTYSMIEQLNEPNSQQTIKHCKNLEDLKRYHDRLSVRINHISPEDIVIFQKTKLVSDRHIQAILSNIDLRDEGIEMEHCISIYAPQILKYEYAAFKVTHPERATLGIKIKPNDQYSIEQIQGKKNSDISNETREYIHQWFYNQLSSINNSLNS